MSVLYEETTASWDNAEFTFHKDFTAHLKLWEDGIEPEQVWEAKTGLEDRAESFRVALKYLGNHSVEIKREDWPTYHFDEQEFTPRTKEEIAIIVDYLRGRRDSFAMCHIELPPFTVHATAYSSPIPLPESMPTVPPDFHRMAETIVAADELSKYPDLVLKLAFLILEDLQGKNVFDSEEIKMMYARNFVSHPICHHTDVVNFVEAELPSARVTGGVQFRRNDNDHMTFVAKYAYPALQRAKELFVEKVRLEGGFLRE